MPSSLAKNEVDHLYNPKLRQFKEKTLTPKLCRFRSTSSQNAALVLTKLMTLTPCFMILRTSLITNGNLTPTEISYLLEALSMQEASRMAKGWNDCWKAEQTNLSYSTFRTLGSRVSSMLTSCRTKTGIARLLASKSTIKRCTQRRFTSIL